MNVRRGTAADVDAALEVWRAAGAASGARPSAARTAQVREQLAARDALLVVDDAGFALGEWGRDDSGALVPGLLRLAMLCVHPSARRQGLGSALAEGLADTAYGKGARRLQAAADSPAVEAFLEALGLQRDGEQWVAELDPPMRELAVREGGLRLGQLLKLAGLVDTGAEAKALLEAGGVEVDGEVELRRGRQLQDGEVVVARDQAVRVVLPD